MEKLDKVIAGLSCCGGPNCGCACEKCPYDNERDAEKVCLDFLMEDALEALEKLREENRDLRKDIEVLTEELTATHDELHRVMKSLSVARLQRKQAWEKLARITGEKYAEWLSESGEAVPEFPKEGM